MSMSKASPENEGLQLAIPEADDKKFDSDAKQSYTPPVTYISPVSYTPPYEQSVISNTEKRQADEAMEARARRRRRLYGIGGVCVVVVLVILAGVIGSLTSKLSRGAQLPSSSVQGSAVSISNTTNLPTSSSTTISATKTSSPTAAAAATNFAVFSLATCTGIATIPLCFSSPCMGFNSQDSPYGQCSNGTMRGCPCQTNCGAVMGPCSSCGGANGFCSGAQFQGCTCIDT